MQSQQIVKFIDESYIIPALVLIRQMFSLLTILTNSQFHKNLLKNHRIAFKASLIKTKKKYITKMYLFIKRTSVYFYDINYQYLLDQLQLIMNQDLFEIEEFINSEEIKYQNTYIFLPGSLPQLLIQQIHNLDLILRFHDSLNRIIKSYLWYIL